MLATLSGAVTAWPPVRELQLCVLGANALSLSGDTGSGYVRPGGFCPGRAPRPQAVQCMGGLRATYATRGSWAYY